MPTVVLKLLAGQGTGQRDGQRGDYMLPPFGSIIIMSVLENMEAILVQIF